MLIDFKIVAETLDTYNILIKGILHIGAHECEEKPFYNAMLGVDDDKIIWIDGNSKKVDMMNKSGMHVYYAVLDETERDVEFNITDNSQASSLLSLNHDKGFYNDIHIIEKHKCKTEKLSTFINRIGVDSKEYNFWNLDIQGSELAVLRGSQELLTDCDVIYTEVNRQSVYTDCGLIDELDVLLSKHGFQRVMTIWTDMQWGDALYLKTSMIQG